MRVPNRLISHSGDARWLPVVMALAFAGFVLAPFLVGYVAAPAGHEFMGTLKALGDEGVYLSAVRQGAQEDRWFWRDQFMVQTPAPVLAYSVYIASGHLGALVHLSVRASYALLHGLAGLGLFATLWVLAAGHLRRAERAWFVLFALGLSGLYWLDAALSAIDHAPAALPWMGMPPLSGLTSALMGAHETIGTAGQIMLLTAMLSLTRRPTVARRDAMIYGGFGTLLVGITLPMLLPLSVLAVLLMTLQVVCREHDRASRQRSAMAIGLPASVMIAPGLLLAAYYFWQISYGAWSAGALAQVSGRPLWEQILQWGVVLPAAVWGWHVSAAQTHALANGLATWCVSALACMALPFWQSFRFSTGLTTFAGGLVAIGVLNTIPSSRVRLRLLCVVGSGAIVHYVFVVAVLASGAYNTLYVPADRFKAMQWVARNTSAQDVVMAPLGFSNQLPELARCRLVAGHGLVTFDFALRERQVDAFYSPATALNERLSVLRATTANLVVYDSGDAENGTFDPRGLPGLQVVYANEEVTILVPQITKAPLREPKLVVLALAYLPTRLPLQ